MNITEILQTDSIILIQIWSVCIIIVFIIFFAMLNEELKPINRQLRQVFGILEPIKERRKSLDRNDVEELSEQFSKLECFENQWEEFRETLVSVKAHDGSEVMFNTRRAGEFINAESLIEHRLHIGVYQAVPSILTGLGLLGTFTALLIALYCLHYNVQTHEVEGINGFINGLSGKFWSSIAGMGSGITFLVIEKFRFGAITRLCIEIEQSLDRLFPQRIAEDILDKMLKHLEEQSNNFSNLSSQLAGSLKDSFQESIVPVMERMVTAVDDLLLAADHLQKHQEESTTEVVERMVSSFQSSLSEHAGDEFKQLAGALDSTAEFVKDMNVKMDEALGSSQKLLTQQQEQAASHLEAIGKAIDTMLSNVDSSIQAQQEKTRQYIIEMQQVFAELTKDIEQSNRTFVDTVQRTVTEMVEKNKEWSESISGAGESVKAAAVELEETFKAQKSFLVEVSSVGNALREASAGLASSTEGLAAVNTATSEGLGKIVEQVSRADSVMKELQLLLERQQSVYEAMDQGVAKVLSSVNVALREYSEHTRESLETNLTIFDKHFSDAANHLGGTVSELATHLDELGEVLEKSLATAAVSE